MHLGNVYRLAPFLGPVLNVFRPVMAPLIGVLWTLFVVNTIQHVIEHLSIRENLVDKSLLVFEHGPIMLQCRDGLVERIIHFTLGFTRKNRFRMKAIVNIILWIQGMGGPHTRRIGF